MFKHMIHIISYVTNITSLSRERGRVFPCDAMKSNIGTFPYQFQRFSFVCVDFRARNTYTIHLKVA